MSTNLDPRLVARLDALTGGAAAANERVRVLVTLDGDVGALEAAGLHTETVAAGVAIGDVELGNLAALAAAEEAVLIQPDAMQHPDLHTSVPEIHADHVRTGALGLSGTGVIVGVVDTGIDIFHHAFRKPDGKTRILSLLDLTIRHTITITGTPTSGSFDLRWTPPKTGSAAPVAQTAAGIPFNASAAQVRQALEALAAINPGDVLVTGGPLPGTPIVFDFAGQYKNQKLNRVTIPTSVLNPGPATITVTRGHEYDDNAINAALTTPGMPFDSVDIDGHGTHVAGTAAGNGSQAGAGSGQNDCHGADYYIGVAPTADLVIVKTSFATSENMQGVAHVFTKATALTKAAVVNCSFGGQRGAHDGSETDEIAFDGLLEDQTTHVPIAGRAIVVSAGNDGNLYDFAHPDRQSAYGGGLHTNKTIAPNGHVDLRLIIKDPDNSDDTLWVWYSGAGRLDVNLKEPGGATLPAVVHPGDAVPSPLPQLAGHDVEISSLTNVVPSGRHVISVTISPAANGKIAAGTWVLTLTETTGTQVDLDSWINLSRTDQHPRFHEDDQTRIRTLTSPATAKNVITIGSYDPRDSTLANSSSRGPTVDPRPNIKPEICAPGVGITAAKSVGRHTGCCCDCCYDFYVGMSGTSMAAPHVTGIVALMLQRNRTLTYVDIRKSLLASHRDPDPITGPTLPNGDWGVGKVDAEKAVQDVVPHAEAVPVPLHALPEPLVLPIAAYSATYLPERARLRALQERVGDGPVAQLAGALVSTHVDEVLRLINSNRRVALAWHRAHGPVLLRLLLAGDADAPLLPATLGGRPVSAGLARLLDELERWGSPALRADIHRYRAFALALPGARLDDVDLVRRRAS